MSRHLVMQVSALALLLGVAAASAAPRLPGKVFACHILGGDGEADIVHVQADSAERARIVAGEIQVSGQSAGERAVRVDVVECIDPARGRFRDKEARQKADSLLQ